MLKITGFILILFSGISLIVMASLFTGIEIDNISYKNINIKKLYLKYDKKLNISAPQILITDETQKDIAEIKTNFTVDYTNFNFEIDVKEFLLRNTDLTVQGKIILDTSAIIFLNKSDLTIENLILQFDKKVKKIYAKKAFVIFQDNQIEATFEEPFYQDVNLSKSKVVYEINSNILKLYLKSTSLLNQSIKNILSRYGVDIQTIQFDGTNDISTNIFIPFDKGDLFIQSDIVILNSNIEDYGEKYKVNKSVIHYQDKKIEGTIDLNSYNYQDVNVTNSILNYTIDVNNKFILTATADQLNVNKEKHNFDFKDSRFTLVDNKISFSSKIIDSLNNLNVDFNNKTDLNTKSFSGNFKLDYDNNDSNISLTANKIEYQGNYKENFQVGIINQDINITKPQVSFIKNLSLNLQHNIIKTNFQLNDPENTYSFNLDTIINLDTNSSSGTLNIDHFIYENLVDIHNKSIEYDVLYDENITLNIPKFGLQYINQTNDNNHIVTINKPKKILDSFTFLKSVPLTNSSISIESHDLNETNININNVNLDINGTYFKANDPEKKISLPIFPKLQLNYFNSFIKYNNHKVSFDKIEMNTTKNKLLFNLQKDKSQITVNTENNNLQAHGYNLSDKFINNLLNQDILEEGYLNINAYSDDMHFLIGDINFHDTTIKNVTLINSLTAFINTTPAIINPFLAIPTLYRMAETGFNTNGYYMKSADGSFKYNIQTQGLDIFDLLTNGKMSNFRVNSHVDLGTEKLQADVQMSFLKDFTSALNYIPVIGYIFLGDDGEVQTRVDITGTLSDPKIETHTVTESALGVADLFKRILTLPLQPFDIETTEKDKEEHNKRVQKMLNN